MRPDRSQCCKLTVDRGALQKLAEVFKFAYCSGESVGYTVCNNPLGPPPTDDQIVPLRVCSIRSFSCEEQLLLYDLFSGDICND